MDTKWSAWSNEVTFEGAEGQPDGPVITAALWDTEIQSIVVTWTFAAAENYAAYEMEIDNLTHVELTTDVIQIGVFNFVLGPSHSATEQGATYRFRIKAIQ